MKKLLILAAFGISGLTSCAKEYTCRCVLTNGESTTQTMKAMMADARETCDDGDEQFDDGSTRECELE